MFYIVFVDVEPMTWDTKGTELGRVGGKNSESAHPTPSPTKVNDQLDLTRDVSTKEVKQRCANTI